MTRVKIQRQPDGLPGDAVFVCALSIVCPTGAHKRPSTRYSILCSLTPVQPYCAARASQLDAVVYELRSCEAAVSACIVVEIAPICEVEKLAFCGDYPEDDGTSEVSGFS